MLKLLLIMAISSCSLLFANSIEKRLEDYFVASLSRYNIKEFQINDIKQLDYPNGWSAYFISLKYNIQERDILMSDVVFSDNVSISRDFIEIESKKSLKEELLKKNENSKNIVEESK
ncbi:MAG: hypothetical protein LBG67_00350 [Campylobacteraceae bacterium]|nr:hypothetical protein [Campylobacteraceae bacterium]